MSKEEAIRVVVVDDHSVVRHGIKSLIAERVDMKCVGESGDGNGALKVINDSNCDVVLMDISIPMPDGIQVMKTALVKHPGLKVIFLTSYEEDQYAIRLMSMGASGYVNKTAANDEIINAIKRVASGGRYFSDRVIDTIMNERSRKKAPSGQSSLTEREFQVLNMLGSRSTPSEIAKALNISPKTVSTHQSKIVKKLNLTKNVDLIHYAIHNQLIGAAVQMPLAL